MISECPHCHETGKIELDITGVCSGCGTLFDEKQIEYLARKPEFPEAANFAVTGNAPKTAETAETGEGDATV